MKRTSEFQTNNESALFIQLLNSIVLQGENNLSIPIDYNRPLLIVVGVPRSGTTLLMQWLSQVGIGVPSNLAARFYDSPYFAGMLQRLLMDPSLTYQGELAVHNDIEFTSNYGKTKGLLSPHEFSFFFRKYFPVTVGEPITNLQDCDCEGFVKGLMKFSTALGLPVAVKGLLIQFALEVFAKYDNVFFIHNTRCEIDNILSLARHRELVANDLNEWISVRPKQYSWLKDMTPLEQIAGQVVFTNSEVEKQLKYISTDRVINVSHEKFCTNPTELFDEISARFRKCGFNELDDLFLTKIKNFSVSKYENDTLKKQAVEALQKIRSIYN